MRKLRDGDCFTLPLIDDKVGVCQIIQLKKSSFYIVVFEKTVNRNELLDLIDTIICSKILFFGETTDARIYHNLWEFICNKKTIITENNIPTFKVETLTGYILVDYKGNKIKRLTKEESKNYNYESSYSPIRFENALKAYHKIIDWVEEYNKILYNPTPSNGYKE